MGDSDVELRGRVGAGGRSLPRPACTVDLILKKGITMPAKPFTIDTRNFANKGDAVRFFRAMLGRYHRGQRVSEVDSLDLRALLKHHTEYAEKLGCGVDYFKVDENSHNTKSFWLIRDDGSIDDFSYLHCITPRND